jgi:glycosyltransferase involved in cell wall biosynthesis
MKARSLHVAVDARVLGERGVGRYLSNLLTALAAIPGPQRYTLFTLAKSKAELVPKGPRFELVNLGDVNPAVAEQYLIPREARARGAQLIHYPDNSGAMRPGLPMVLTMHDGMWRRRLGESLLHPTLRQRLQDAYRKFVCPRAARAAARVITVSQFSARELDGELGLGPKLRVIPNGLDPGFKKPLPPSRAKSLVKGLGLQRPYVLCSGAADRRKNISAFIRAFAQCRLKGVDLVVSSMRPGELKATDYLKTAQKAGIEGSVKFLGFVSEDELKALYQGALAYAFPSLWEGFGLPVLEAYAMRCPVLCSTAGALPEVAGEGAMMMHPESLASMAGGLDALLGGSRPKQVAKGLKELKRFSWKKAAEETLKAYAEAAAS